MMAARVINVLFYDFLLFLPLFLSLFLLFTSFMLTSVGTTRSIGFEKMCNVI